MMSLLAPAVFILFGPAHLATLALIVVLSVVLILIARLAKSEKADRYISITLAIILLLNKAAEYATIYVTGEFDFPNALPMHMCDWSAIAVIIALLWRRQLPYELAYFWGLGGTLQATITPALGIDFPDIRFITFFVSHGGTLVAILFLTIGLRMRPYPKSLIRIFIWSNIYLAAAGITDFLLRTNYGYLRHKPLSASLLDYLGPWPFYILSLEGMALVSFLIYYIPFFLIDLKRKPATPSVTACIIRVNLVKLQELQINYKKLKFYLAFFSLFCYIIRE